MALALPCQAGLQAHGEYLSGHYAIPPHTMRRQPIKRYSSRPRIILRMISKPKPRACKKRTCFAFSFSSCAGWPNFFSLGFNLPVIILQRLGHRGVMVDSSTFFRATRNGYGEAPNWPLRARNNCSENVDRTASHVSADQKRNHQRLVGASLHQAGM